MRCCTEGTEDAEGAVLMPREPRKTTNAATPGPGGAVAGGQREAPSGGTLVGGIEAVPDVSEAGKDPHGTFPFRLFGTAGLRGGAGRCTGPV